MDLESVGDLGRRVFVEMLESECVGKKEIVLNNFYMGWEDTQVTHGLPLRVFGKVWAPLKRGKSEEEQNLSYEPKKEFWVLGCWWNRVLRYE